MASTTAGKTPATPKPKKKSTARKNAVGSPHLGVREDLCEIPHKAAEVVTGSIPAVPTNGLLVVESTAGGLEGEFFDMVQRSEALDASKAKLTPKDLTA